MRVLAAFLAVLLLASGAQAQTSTRVGPLVIQNNLSEIARNGSSAQAAARASLGITTLGTLPLPGGTTTYLRADGTFNTPPGSGGGPPGGNSGDIQINSGSGTFFGRAIGLGLTDSGTAINASVQSVLGRTGAVSLQSADVTAALGFDPVQSVFGRTGTVSLLSSDVAAALGFTPYSAANPAGYITAGSAPVQSVFGRSGAVVLLSADIATALGFTPVDASGLAASAFTDTTNAANIASGTLPAARLPNPSPTTIGGVQSFAAASHQFLTGISTGGVISAGQPAVADISGLGSLASQSAAAVAITGGSLSGSFSGAPNFTGAVAMSGLSAGSLVSCLGLDVTNNVVLGCRVNSVFGRSGDVVLQSSDVATALGFSPVQSVFGRTGIVAMLSGDVTAALGFTPVSTGGGTVTGALNLTAGGSLTGTFTGNPNFTGTSFGIGTTTPTARLDIKGTDAVAGTLAVLAENSAGSPLFGVDDAGTSTLYAAPVLADGAGHNGSLVLQFPSRAALAVWQPTKIGTNMLLARTAGYTTAGDGGDAEFVWVAADTTANWDNLVIQPTGWASAGRWHMVMPPGGVHPEAFGLKCDGTTDDSIAWNNMTSFMGTYFPNAAGPPIAFIPGHTCFLGTAHTVGSGGLLLRGNYNPINAPNTAIVQVPNITLDPATTFLLGGMMENVYIRRANLPAPANMEQEVAAVQQWAAEGSVGVTISRIYAVIQDSLIVGFNQCLYMSGQAPLIVRNLNVDCANGIEVTNDRGGSQGSGLRSGNFYAFNLNLHQAIIAVAVTSPGTGYSNGAVLTMTGGTCTTAPQITITTSGGAITGATVSDAGDCTGTTAASPTFTGGGGASATFSAFWAGPAYRPGKGLYVHDYCDACTFSDVVMSNYHIGIDVSNVFTNTFSNINLEPGTSNSDFTSGDTSAIGVLIENCTTAKFSNVYLASGLGTALYVNDRSQSDGGTGCVNNVQPMVTFSNVELDSPSTEHNQQMLYLAPHSRGEMSNLVIGGPGYVAGSSVVIAANTRDWLISGLVGSGGTGATTPLYSVDPTSAPNVRIESLPATVPLTSGALLTVGCNTAVLVNDATAPTITLPAVCPIGQDVRVNAGPLASAHNITLAMPGGSTLDGSASQSLSVNYATARISWNGVAAYLNGSAGGGSGGTTARLTVASGSTYAGTATLAATNTVLMWNSASGAAKATSLQGCSGAIDGYRFQVADEQGDADRNNVVITPTSGTINKGATATLYGAHGSLSLVCDGSTSNWAGN